MVYKFANAEKDLPQTQIGFRKGLGTADALLLLTRNLQASLDRRAEWRIISLEFSSAFDLVNHQALMFKPRLMGIGGSLFNVFKEFLTNRIQLVTVDSRFSQFRPVVSEVLPGSVLGPLLFILFTADMWNNLENKIVFYVDDTILYFENSTVSDHLKVLIL